MPTMSPLRDRPEQQPRADAPAEAFERWRVLVGTGDMATYVRLSLIAAAVVVETLLLLVALVPQSQWAARGYPQGPIPQRLYAVVAALFYFLPTLTGALCRRWQFAVVLATAPAWLDLGAFAMFAASKVGPFYVAQQDHAVSTVGTLELFAVLGGLGWLSRTALLLLWRRGEWGRA